MNWFYESGGQQMGPVSEAELDRLIAEGRVTPKTLVWREGLPDWQPLEVARPTVAPNTARCASCGQFFPAGDLVDIGGRSICSSCKPAVLQELQQSGAVVNLGDEARNEPAWERRHELGIFPAAWKSLQDVLIKPVETFSAMRREGGLGTPFLYALLLGSIGGIVNALFQLLMRLAIYGAKGPVMPAMPPNFPPEFTRYLELMQSPIAVLSSIILVPVGVTISMFVGSGIMHLCLMLCGGANRPFETTFRVYCYAAGSALALEVVPGCGVYVAAIWNLVCTCIGLAKAHETDTWRAVVAVLLPIIVCCAGIFAVIGGAIAIAAGSSH